ncbi:MAG: alcohol dehydrogenase catalytic domain-containing protein, partial [Lachnospiraceae bacterium]|nr:alcohol dehydrogenase catalytic domain-containing protein [Lachnospiraceae bacterium]
MKAWVLHGVDDIRFEEVDSPHPAEDEVVVSVRAAGICGSDIPRIYQTGAHVHPLIPG